MHAILTLLIVLQPAQADDTVSGQEIFAARCATCHGTEGRGDGPAASALPRKPKDLTDPEFWKNTTVPSIRQTILKGRPGTAMRAYPMDDAKLDSLVTYLQSLEAKPE